MESDVTMQPNSAEDKALLGSNLSADRVAEFEETALASSLRPFLLLFKLSTKAKNPTRHRTEMFPCDYFK